MNFIKNIAKSVGGGLRALLEGLVLWIMIIGAFFMGVYFVCCSRRYKPVHPDSKGARTVLKVQKHGEDRGYYHCHHCDQIITDNVCANCGYTLNQLM
jgi:hypothetical protein